MRRSCCSSSPTEACGSLLVPFYKGKGFFGVFWGGGSGLGGSAWTLLGAGAGSGCEQSSRRLGAQIRTEVGGFWVAWSHSRRLSVAKSLLKGPFAFTDKLLVHKQKEPVVVQHTGFIQHQRETLSNALCWFLRHVAGLNGWKPTICTFSFYYEYELYSGSN